MKGPFKLDQAIAKWRKEMTAQGVRSRDVLDELENGEFPQKGDALALMQGVPLLEIGEAIAEVVDAYIKHHLMPADPIGDALHLALASFHRCDFC